MLLLLLLLLLNHLHLLQHITLNIMTIITATVTYTTLPCISLSLCTGAGRIVPQACEWAVSAIRKHNKSLRIAEAGIDTIDAFAHSEVLYAHDLFGICTVRTVHAQYMYDIWRVYVQYMKSICMYSAYVQCV